jgi:integrase
MKSRAKNLAYLNDAAIKKLKPGAKTYTVYDEQILGFFVRVLRSGTLSYGLRAKREGSKVSYFYTLGEVSSFSNDYAREWAKQTRQAVQDGRDPRTEAANKHTGVTFKEAFELFKTRQLFKEKWTPGTAKKYSSQFHRHVPKTLKKKLIKEIDLDHLSNIHDSLKSTPAEANRLRSMLIVLFAYAERKNWRPKDSNVAEKLEPWDEIAKSMKNGSGYALNDSEYASLMAYLDQAIARRHFLLARNKKGRPINRRKKDEFLPDIFILLALKFIALTGLRHREPLRLKWEHIFEKEGIIRIEEAKNDFQTKDITPEITELLALARDAAKALGREESEWVFPSRKSDGVANGRFHYGPTVNLEKSWLIIREHLGLGNTHIIPSRKKKKVPVRIHDLRHTYGTMAYQAIKNVDDVQRLMNHDQRASTDIYIHLLEEQRKKDALTVGAAMKEKTQKAPA